MPQYEALLILRIMERPQTTQAVKRATEVILNKGGVMRSFECLGQRNLPYRMSKLGEKYNEGMFFMMNFDSQTSLLPILKEHLQRDPDVIRPRILRKEQETGRPCADEPCTFGELTEESRKKLRKNLRGYVEKL